MPSLLSITPDLRYTSRGLVAATPWQWRVLSLGSYCQKVVVDVHECHVTQRVQWLWFCRRKIRYTKRDIAAVIYGDRGYGAMSVGILTKNRREIMFFHCQEAQVNETRVLGVIALAWAAALGIGFSLNLAGNYFWSLILVGTILTVGFFARAAFNVEYFPHHHSNSIFDPNPDTSATVQWLSEQFGPDSRAASRVIVDVMSLILNRPVVPPAWANPERRGTL